MKKALLFVCCLIMVSSLAFGQAWNPTPMIISVPDRVQYAFDGSSIDIPFDLAGKPGKLYLIVNSKLADNQKPVAVQNGFKGWHFVNGIDTTIYVSEGRNFTQGKALTFPWDGHGNEKAYDKTVDSGKLAPGTYSFYIMGYDNVSTREVANKFLEMGHFQPPQGMRFYPNDPQTGALLAHPLIMGKATNSGGVSGTAAKFALGDDPYDVTKVITTFCFGFKKGDVVKDQTVSVGTLIFKPDDYETFYLSKSKQFEFAGTVTKWQFVPGGEAVQDMAWGDWNKATEWTNLGDNPGGAIDMDGNGYIYWQLGGKNPINYPIDRLIIFPEDDLDPKSYVYNATFLEYYTATPVPQTDLIRNGSECTRMSRGPQQGQIYMGGDGSCLAELIDAGKMINEGTDDPWSADGSGYVIWSNSNGDWYLDKNAEIEPKNPPQLWTCVSYEPRNINDLRASPSPADQNGFTAMWLEFASLYAVGPVTQDGTGIDYWHFADDSFSSGGDNTQKKGNGWAFSAGTIYDGLYTHMAMQANPAWGDASYRATCWFASDSDGGIITSEPVGVEEESPVAFSVSQNTPNPFNPTTTINFTLAQQGQVSVDVFNVAGQKVTTLANETMSAGSHTLTWDAAGFSAGVYFYTVKSGDISKTMKMTLLK